MADFLKYVPGASVMVPYIAFSFILFYTQWTAKNFRGAWESFGRLLGAIAFAGMVFKWGYLLYYGYVASWQGAVVLFIVGAVASLVLTYGELMLVKIFGGFVPYLLGWSGIVVLPVLAYVMVLRP